MQAGIELDELVAEKVMGWEPTPVERLYGTEAPPVKYRTPDGYLVSKHGLPPYSTDIAAAWQVIETLASRGIWSIVQALEKPGWYSCEFFDYDTNTLGESRAETAPLTICLAALQAVGVEV